MAAVISARCARAAQTAANEHGWRGKHGKHAGEDAAPRAEVSAQLADVGQSVCARSGRQEGRTVSRDVQRGRNVGRGACERALRCNA